MWQKAGNIIKRWPAATLVTLSLVLNGIFWLVAILTFPREVPAAVLHYSVGVGIDFIGEGKQVLVLPGIGLAIIAVDGILAAITRGVMRLGMWILLASAILAQILLIIAYSNIYILNL